MIDGNPRFLIDECLSPELTDIAKGEYGVFRAVMDFISDMPDIVDKLIEVDSTRAISVADWPNHANPDQWRDPFNPE